MKRMQAYWAVAGLFLVLMIASLSFFLSAQFKKTTGESSVLAKAKPYQEIEGLSLTEYYAGKERMLIKAEKASIRPKKIGFLTTSLVKEAHLVKPDIFLYDDGKWISRIKADYATMDISNKKMFLRQNVTLTTADGERLSTKKMVFAPEKGVISLKGEFTLNIKGDTIRGEGLIADVGLKKFARQKKR